MRKIRLLLAAGLLLGAVCGCSGWMLDFAGMSRWIGFNHKNQWHFRTLDHPYRFALEDLVFDRHGFPHEKAR